MLILFRDQRGSMTGWQHDRYFARARLRLSAVSPHAVAVAPSDAGREKTMKRLLFAVLLSACGSVAAETSQNQTATATQSDGKPIEKSATRAERPNCADWNNPKVLRVRGSL